MDQKHFSRRFSSNARKALREAERFAQSEKGSAVEPKHLLLALLVEESGLAKLFLSNAGFKKDSVQQFYLGDQPGKVPTTRSKNRKQTPLSQHLKTILSHAHLAASEFRSPYIGTEHLAYAILENPDQDIADFLDAAGIEEDGILDHLEAHLSFENFPNFGKMFDFPDIAPATRKKRGDSDATPFLSQYTIDLGEDARERGLGFFGRDEELARLTHILGRKQKNNPLLIGEPGVGKTALASALAKNILDGNVPESLIGKRILSLDLALVVAGTSFRGEFESRLKEIVREASEDRNVILFIDELHTIVGAGNTQGGLDAANILKPALARGDIRVIGATTLSEYKRHIEKDPALERRFQNVFVREPSPMETKKLLRHIKGTYETFHSVSISPAIIDLAVDLSVRHLHERFLPDKAIDILDEASSLSRHRVGTRPEIRAIAELESDRRRILEKKERSMEEGLFDDAAELLEEEKRIHREIAELSLRAKKTGGKSPIATLTEQDLLETLSAITGIPFSKLKHDDPQERLRQTGRSLRTKVVNQDEAVRRIESALVRSLSDTRNPDRPIGSFLFLGPTGVGKTFIAKTLSEEFFGGSRNLIRLDMSEFMERHNVAQMIGSPAGYVGYGEGGKLTERIRRTPHAVVLFDEIEKAHPDIFNVLLQILDEGTLTDAEGRSASFRHAIVVLTSNIGTEAFTKNARIGFDGNGSSKNAYETVKVQVLEELKRTLRPELLARIDHTVVFDALGKEATEKIVRNELDTLKKRLAKKGISLSVPAHVVRFLAEKSFAPEHGARLVRKNIDDFVEHPIALALLSKRNLKKRKLRLAVEKDSITCKEA